MFKRTVSIDFFIDPHECAEAFFDYGKKPQADFFNKLGELYEDSHEWFIVYSHEKNEHLTDAGREFMKKMKSML